MKTDPNDLVGPVTIYKDPSTSIVHGLTKREFFALKAMEALESRGGETSSNTAWTVDEVVNRAVRMADSLIIMLNEKSDENNR